MGLNETSDIVNWPDSHYVFIEKTGPFQETAPKAWQELHSQIDQVKHAGQVLGMMSLYKIQPKMIYRAVMALDKKPSELPKDFLYEYFSGGKYLRFVLTGSYSQLPQAVGRVFEIVKQNEIKMRDNFFIQNYANDSKVTPEEKLITEILIPVP